MSPRAYTHVLIALAVTVMALSVWFTGRAQRETVSDSFRQSETVAQLLTGMLNQETGLRGYLNTGRSDFLDPYLEGQKQFATVITRTEASLPVDDQTGRALFAATTRSARAWNQNAARAVRERREGRVNRGLREMLVRKRHMDAFRRSQAALVRHIGSRRDGRIDRVAVLSVLLIVGLSLLFTLGSWLTFGRRMEARARRRRLEMAQRERQTSFAHTLQFMDTEEDAHQLVKRHLEESIGKDTSVVVLRRNNSADRLELATPVAGPIVEALFDAEPRSCLAVRLGAIHEGGAPGELLNCGLCGKTEAELTTCTPLLVQGEVTGSVLVAHHEPLDEVDRQFVEDTITQAAPVVANMRNLAIAELRAATDALTGLPNRRAIQDTLRRMVAQATRGEHSLAAVALDLDHFKQINDRFGHDKGDDVLAAAAEALTATLRTSDFVGRMGGEEFIVLLPDTDLEGALVAAENLRAELERVRIAGVDRPITASFGVAVLPADALDADGLLRQADRALYAAKGRGRNRVEVASAVSPQIPA